MNGLFAASYQIANDGRECVNALYSNLVLLKAASKLPSFGKTGEVDLSCVGDRVATTSYIRTAAQEHDVFFAFTRAGLDLTRELNVSTHLFDLTVTRLDQAVGSRQVEDFVRLQTGEICGNLTLLSVPEPVDIATCGSYCSGRHDCQCMHYSESGNGACELALGYWSDVVFTDTGGRKTGYRYRPLRDVTWDVESRYRTVPLSKKTNCSELFANSSLTSTARILILGQNREVLCRHSGVWLQDASLSMHQAITVHTDAPVTIYNHPYDVRWYSNRTFIFSQERHRAPVVIRRDISCSALFGTPPFDVYVMLNRGYYCRCTRSMWTVNADIRSGDEFAVYFSSTELFFAVRVPE